MKEIQPKVSVLMPIYDTKERHLRDSIESILNQTFKDFEFLILNDSPYNLHLKKIVESYKDIRISYYENERNLGITPSRNKLIALAKGEYLAVMDHDDISLPKRLEKQVACLDLDLQIGVVGCWVERFPHKKIKRPLEKDEDIKKSLMMLCPIIHPASMIRADVLRERNIYYEEEFSPSEDYMLWCRLIPHTQFYNIQEVLFKYREHFTNTTKKQFNKMQQATERIYCFVRQTHPVLWKDFQQKAFHIYRLRLFGFIPCLTMIRQQDHLKVFLWKIFLLYNGQVLKVPKYLRIHQKDRKVYVYLFKSILLFLGRKKKELK